MVQNGYFNLATMSESHQFHEDTIHQSDSDDDKPTYALEHLATFKVKNEKEIQNPKEKMKLLMELDRAGGIWPQKMFMRFSGQWLVMLDSVMNEIENFPGSLIKEPTAFFSEDPLEMFNNILIFTVPGASLGNTEMHMFQVNEVSAVNLVEDLIQLSNGKSVNINRNSSHNKLPKKPRPVRNTDQYGIAVAAAEVAAEKNANERQQFQRDAQVVNQCFEDIERFVSRLQYASEALQELQQRQSEHNPHGEGLLILRSRPPLESEFLDIFAKYKLALNYIVKLQSHFSDPTEPIQNLFTSLKSIVDNCNDVHIGAKIPENVVNPLLRRETVIYLKGCLNDQEMSFWKSLGKNWTTPKEQFKDHKGTYHPIFYDDWSPDWTVDPEVAYIPPPPVKKTVAPAAAPPPPQVNDQEMWLARLEASNVKIAQVIFDKKGQNDKELNAVKGEYVEIIDESRRWWKARSSNGNVGYIPSTILAPRNFEIPSSSSGKDTDSLSSSMTEPDQGNNFYRNLLSVHVPSAEQETKPQPKPDMIRSYSASNVPEPPPMPLPKETQSQPTTPVMAERNSGVIVAMRARNDYESSNQNSLILPGDVNDELKHKLQQREQRRDLEILITPQIYINQNSSAKEVEEWLRAKGFSDVIVKKLKILSGEELFALSPHTIEGYFGQKESRRLISQILLQKNISEYKTIRSSELSSKLARARQKVETQDENTNEIF